jgi:hypothetical protein
MVAYNETRMRYRKANAMVLFVCRRGKFCGDASQEVILFIGLNKGVTMEEIFCSRFYERSCINQVLPSAQRETHKKKTFTQERIS